MTHLPIYAPLLLYVRIRTNTPQQVPPSTYLVPLVLLIACSLVTPSPFQAMYRIPISYTRTFLRTLPSEHNSYVLTFCKVIRAWVDADRWVVRGNGANSVPSSMVTLRFLAYEHN